MFVSFVRTSVKSAGMNVQSIMLNIASDVLKPVKNVRRNAERWQRKLSVFKDIGRLNRKRLPGRYL